MSERVPLKERLRRVPVVGTAITVQDRYAGDLGNHLAASMAFFGFLSLLPLLLLALSVVGYVLADDPEAVRTIVASVATAVPGLGETMEASIDAVIRNRGVTGAVGLAGVLLAGLRVVDAATVATTRVFRQEDTSNVIVKKLRAVGILVVLGLLAIVSTLAGAAVGLAGDTAVRLGLPAEVSSLAGWMGPVVSLVVDVVLFAVAYRLMAVRSGPPWRELLPGALLAACGWTALKAVGAAYASSSAERWDALYGTLGSVIGALLLLFLAGRIFIYGAELNAVRAGRREPVTGPPATVEQRDEATLGT